MDFALQLQLQLQGCFSKFVFQGCFSNLSRKTADSRGGVEGEIATCRKLRGLCRRVLDGCPVS